MEVDARYVPSPGGRLQALSGLRDGRRVQALNTQGRPRAGRST